MDRPEVVVDLTGVRAEDAYAWGVEAGAFLADARTGEVEGMHVFSAGNMKMIQMIADERQLEVTVYESENNFVRCWVAKRKHHKLRVVT